MALSNAQYDAIMRVYDEKRRDAQLAAADRLQEIYEKIPRYQVLEEEIAEEAGSVLRRLSAGEMTAVDSVKEKISVLSNEKKTLLKEAGFPENYPEPEYECKDCSDTGFMPDGEPCSCFQRQKIALLYRQSNLSSILNSENFLTLSEDYYTGPELEVFRKTVQDCHKFVDDFPKEYAKRDYTNLVFYGNVGTGKSFLTSCIAKELLDQGRSVLYFSAIDLFSLMSDVMFRRGEEGTLKMQMPELYECELLIIDDLGTEYTNNAVALQLFSLLNERILLQKSTIISTNFSLEELQVTYADRIFSRIIGYYKFLKFTGPDIRREKARRGHTK